MTGWLTVIGGLIGLITWAVRYFNRKARQKRKLLDDAKKMFEEGMKESDTSKIVSAFNRLHRN